MPASRSATMTRRTLLTVGTTIDGFKNVDATQARYQVGAATLLEVTQARAQQVQAASALATARNNLVLQQSVMSYYTGELEPGKMVLE
jgi:outer membrane protein TolC